jgi:hypothetical protein
MKFLNTLQIDNYMINIKKDITIMRIDICKFD